MIGYVLEQAEGVRGLLIYEAIERGLEQSIERIYTDLARLQGVSIGRYHWESWVADSQQEASHGFRACPTRLACGTTLRSGLIMDTTPQSTMSQADSLRQEYSIEMPAIRCTVQ